MKILKPPRLNRGDVIGIAAPASPPSSPEKLSKGIRYLEQLGYHIVLGKHVHNGYGYLAGMDNERAGDLNALFSNPKVKAIFVVRGGYGSHRILHRLDYNIIKRNPKIFVGYSDITALHLAIFTKTGLITFSGPMVATEFGDELDGNAEEQFWKNLTSTTPLGILKNPNRKKMKPLKRGVCIGRLLAGNLSIVSALLGTPYLDTMKGCILALEEIEEPPYKVDRMLHHLRHTGMFSQSSGVVLGEFTDCTPTDAKKPSLTLSQIFHDVFSSSRLPILRGLHYGHVKDSLTLPLGITTRLDASHGTLELLESPIC